jgi:hypothetical protein
VTSKRKEFHRKERGVKMGKNNKTSEPKEKYGIVSPYLLDKDSVIGLGTMIVPPDAILVRFGTDYLKKAIKIVEELDADEITFCIKTDYPLVMGNYNKEKKHITGVMVAPRCD